MGPFIAPALLRVSAAEPNPTRGMESETDGHAGVITVALRCGVSVVNWPFSPLYHLATLHMSAVSLPGKAVWQAAKRARVGGGGPTALQRRSCCRLCRTLVSSSKLMKSLDIPGNRQPTSTPIRWHGGSRTVPDTQDSRY